MKLNTSTTRHRPVRTRRRIRVITLGVVGACLFGLGALSQFFGIFDPIGERAERASRALRSDPQGLAGRVASGMFATPRKLYISISFERFQELSRQRERALATGVLTVDEQDYVSATLEIEGESISIRMRLKGDLTDHLRQSDKWSFRVKTRGERTVLGMKQFSLHHPSTRNYIYEWIFHRALGREDIIGLRYEFVRVVMNGRDIGVYALEEHFERRLVENRERREGPIVQFGEERLWSEWRNQKIPFDGARQSGSGSFLASEVDAFQSERWHADSVSAVIHDRALETLERFRSGEQTTSGTFNVEKLAMFLAITDVMGGEHGARWHNTRFFYNAITSRLEPIGFDADAGAPIAALCYHMKDRHWSANAWSSDSEYFARLFDDEVLVTQYFAALDRVSNTAYLDSLLAEIDVELRANLRILHSEFPGFVYSPHILRRNQQYIRSVLEPENAIAAHVGGARGDQSIRVANLQSLPVEVFEVTTSDRSIDVGRIPLEGRRPTDLVSYRDLGVRLTPADSTLASIRVRFRVPGLTTAHDVAVTPEPFPERGSTELDLLRRPANARDFGFLHVDDARRVVVCSPGSWQIEDDLIVPEGYVFKCGPGTRLDLSPGKLILSRSPLEFLGTEDQPIGIVSTGGMGQGLVVMSAKSESIVEHVEFQRLAAPARHGWSLTGAVTFYKSPVSMRRCRWSDTGAEDAVNFVRTRFRVADSVISRSRSDALDADFCVGEIRDVRIEGCGNDGIDLSGTTAQLHGVVVIDAGDKGFSIGERSATSATRLTVNQSRIGIAIKDLSSLSVEDVRLTDCKYGITLYQKKPEFGPSSARMRELQMEGVSASFEVERRCTLEVDGDTVSATGVDVGERLEPEGAL